MTEREFLNKVIETTEDSSIQEYANSRLQKLDSKNESRRNTLTKTQKENEKLFPTIKEIIAKNGSMVASEIGTALAITTQKASALCRQLVDKGELVSTEIKITGKGKVKSYSLSQES